ncbi:MAG: phage tail protein [Lachnospiraceae bacterium]|jgi:phage tail protein X|nr:phage tail protein [Lachnospiraceae bacterium]
MGGYYYITRQGDMWDYIAWVVYQNEKMVEVLLNAAENREHMTDYIFSAGVKIWCPDVAEQAALSDRPSWRDS